MITLLAGALVPVTAFTANIVLQALVRGLPGPPSPDRRQHVGTGC